MQSTSSITIKVLSLLLVLCALFPAAPALAMDDELSLAMISVKSTRLNPLTAEEREFQSLTALIYEGLYQLDDEYKHKECLVQSCSIDGKKWHITLRNDIYFHDGTPVTAYDVVATIDEILRLAEEGKGQYAQLKYIVSKATANDATSLVLNVSRPYIGVYYALTFPVLPASQVQADHPVGTGPYKVDTFSPGNFLYLSANENWHEDTPAVQHINVTFKNTNRALLDEYEFNRVDAAITRSAAAGQYRTGITNLNIPYRTRQLEVLLMNYNKVAFPLNDEKVRQAVRYAIDVDAICNNVYSGMAERTDTPLPKDTWMYNENVQPYAYNPEKAKELLKEAGWEDLDGDGVLDKIVDDKNRRLHMRLYTYEEQDNNVREQAATMMKRMLEDVGFEIKLEVLTFAAASEKLRASNFDFFLAAFQMDTVPDPGFLLMSSNTGNYVAYKSTQMDKLFKQLRETMDFDKYQSLLYDIQEQYIQDSPFISLYYRNGALLTRKVFTNERDTREPEILRGIESISN